MGRIRVLPPEIANRIAAGEVVERPASIVKELVENALDAGAARILVEIEDGGKGLIRVTDDGLGMDSVDLALSVERHATSKIRDSSDLDAIRTMGFRGEALPSIGSVARLTVTSRPADSPEGHRLIIHSGMRTDFSPVGCPKGTSVQVEDLFLDFPARRHFLKGRQTELGHVSNVLRAIAVSSPDVEFELRSEGKPVFQTRKGRSGPEILAPLLGEGLAGRLVPVEGRGQSMQLSGFITPPVDALGSSKGLHVFLNRRYIRSSLVWKAVTEGARGLLTRNLHPAGAVFIRMDPGAVDVNVHPTKQEVRFHQPDEVFRTVRRAVRDALSSCSQDFAPPPGHHAIPSQPRPSAGGVTLPFVISEPEAARWESGRPRQAEDTLPPWEYAPTRTGAGTLFTPLAQFSRSYILAEGPGGLVVIDQHAAHEAILFARLSRRLSTGGNIPSQPLLFPKVMERHPDEISRIPEMEKLLTRIGLMIEPFGPGEIIVRAIPEPVRADASEEIVSAVLGSLAEEPADVFREILARIACHGAVRANAILSRPEMERLLAEIEEEGVTHCPHGRPAMRLFAKEEIERWFGRR